MDIEALLVTKFDATTKVWSGPKSRPMYHPDISVGQIVHMNLFSNPKNVLQINDTEGIQLTNEAVLLLSTRVAINLMQKGVTQKDVVGIIAGNTSYVMPVCYGTLFLGAPFHPLDVSFNKEAIAHSWKKTTPKVVFCDGHAYERVKEVKEENGLNYIIFTLNHHIEGVPKVDDLFVSHPMEKIFRPLEVPSGEETAVILCSSGTTGLSKSVCLSHRSCNATFGIILDTCDDVVLNFSSLYWLSGCFSMLACGITGATYLVISKPFTPEQALYLIDKYRVTKTMFPPRNIALVLESPDIQHKSIKSIKTLNCGGAKLPVEIRNRIKKYMSPTATIFFGYGTTEVGGIAFTLSEKFPESTGILIPNVEVKIVDENGNNLGIGEDGEICVANGHKWPGYFGDKAATDEVYEAETWYHTGDLGHFDENGYLYIVDRIKEIMKSKGYHISPSEIEDVVLQLPDVADVCVCGIPDILSVNKPAAFVIKSVGSNITEQTIITHVSAKMPHYKHLTGGVYFVDELPRTPSGKILRRVVAKEAEKLYNLQNGRNEL
ncbi:hypothetical protein ACFFRR_002195 [Megaselia abdita]